MLIYLLFNFYCNVLYVYLYNLFIMYINISFERNKSLKKHTPVFGYESRYCWWLNWKQTASFIDVAGITQSTTQWSPLTSRIEREGEREREIKREREGGREGEKEREGYREREIERGRKGEREREREREGQREGARINNSLWEIGGDSVNRLEPKVMSIDNDFFHVNPLPWKLFVVCKRPYLI